MWTLKKEISVPQIVTVVGALITVTIAYTDLKQAVAVQETTIQFIADSLADIKHELKEIKREIRKE